MRNTKIPDITEHFSSRSAVYDKFGNWVNNDTMLSSIIKCIPEGLEEKISIIDLGAGTGAVSKYILKNYPFNKEITAVDICPDMLAMISELEINKCIASLEEMPFLNDIYDVAVSRQCLHYIENLEQVMQEIKRILKKDSTFILSQIVPLESDTRDYWNRIIKYRQPLRKHYFSENEWINLFKKEGFSHISTERFSHRGSVLKWAKKYGITDSKVIDKYKDMLLGAPQKFIKEYNVVQNLNDVEYDTFCFVAKFEISK